MSHNGKLTNSTGWNAIFSWIKYALTGKRDNAQAVQDTEVSAESLVDLNARVEALESALTSLGVGADKVDYKIVQKAVANPSVPSSGTTTATSFISAIAQNENGEIVPERRNLPAASASVSGITKVYTSTGDSTDGTMTRQAITNALAGKSDTGHTHDDRYYTETEVDTFLAAKAEQVDVTNYTSFADIGAVIRAGNIPYCYHAVGTGGVRLDYQGTHVSNGVPPSVSQLFAGVFNGVLYETRFVDGASAFSAVTETPIFSTERVVSSGESSSWSSDDTNVPTRAAVESKISSAMSGSLGGFLGPKSPNDISLYQLSGHTFLKGDWFVVSESGAAYYYPNNDRSASAITLNMLEGEEYYWTTSGTFVKKPSTSLQIYAITNLSDWNDLTNTGLYQIASQASNVQNSPSTGNCVCYVCDVNGAVVQFVISPNHIYKRYRGGSGSGQWGSWMAVDNIEIIVGSTSFNDLKALYGMTKNLVAVGSETVSSNNYTTLFALVSVKLSGSTPTEFIFERSCPHSAGQVGQVEQKICASSGWSSSTLDVQHAKVADDYSLTGNIAIALSQKLGANSVSWLLAVDLTYTKYSCFGGLFDSGSIGSIFWLSEIIYNAGYTARIDIRGNFGAITSSERFSIFPPYGYCGSAEGGGEIRRKLKQYVRYIVTITNTGSSKGTIYACCGGRATTTTAGYWRKGVIWLDGDKSATPASGSPTEWDVGYLNKVALGSVPANGSKTWEFWWYEVADIEGSLFSGCDYMFVTTIK